MVDDLSDDLPATATPDLPLQGESNFWDSSKPLFSMYSKAAEEEDNKMVRHWQKDAEGILLFVSPRVGTRLSLHMNRNTIDRFIRCLSRCTPCCYRPGPETKHPGYIRILPWQYLSGSCRPERNTLTHFFPCRKSTPILSPEICRLGEFSLVLEPGDEL